MIFLGEKSSVHAGDDKDRPLGELLIEKTEFTISVVF